MSRSNELTIREKARAGGRSMVSVIRTVVLRQRQNRPPSVAASRPGGWTAVFTRAVSEWTFVSFSVREQTFFAKRLSFLIKAGVPLVECLHIIRSQAKSRSRQGIYDTILNNLAQGKSLSAALSKYRRLFGDFAINIIRVGEQSGILAQNLSYLADELQKKYVLQRKVRGALIYPIFITIATLGVTSLLTVYIFPKIMPIFISLNVELPLTTRILLAIANYLETRGIITVLVLIALGVVLAVVRRLIVPVRYWGDRLLLSLPVMGVLARTYNLANFTRTLGLLLKSGVHVTEAMHIVAETTRNLVYQREFYRIAQKLTTGEQMCKSLERNKALFPDMLPHLVAIGETTGNLPDTLTYLAESYEAEVDERTKNLSSSIEPILMIVMGIIVGLIAVSVITPIYAITQQLQR